MTSCIYILRFIFVNVYFLVNISILIKTNQSVEIYFSLNKKKKKTKEKQKNNLLYRSRMEPISSI